MKFYKIVDPNGHRGLIYKEGYNEDPLPFNPSGDCEAGGIYFAKEDILAFLDYGTELYEVEPIGEVYENPSKPKKYKAKAVNLKYIGKIGLETIKMLIEEGANIHAGEDYALRWAAKRGYTDIVKYLVENGANIHACGDCALQLASREGHFEVVKYLVEHGADIHFFNELALRLAIEYGHFEVVKYLIEKGANLCATSESSLEIANVRGHTKLVRYLKRKIKRRSK